VSKVENYRKSIELKKQQLESLDASVDFATKLFQGALTDYMDVLFVLRDQRLARTELIETKQQQLSAIVNTYQALGGGMVRFPSHDHKRRKVESTFPMIK
jgi:multidrug efflux system outer membrane protein